MLTQRIYLLYEIIVAPVSISYWRALGIEQHYNGNYPRRVVASTLGVDMLERPNDILEQKVTYTQLRSLCTETELFDS